MVEINFYKQNHIQRQKEFLPILNIPLGLAICFNVDSHVKVQNELNLKIFSLIIDTLIIWLHKMNYIQPKQYSLT